MNRRMPLSQYRGQMDAPEAVECILSYRIWFRLSFIFLLLFIGGVVFGVIRDRNSKREPAAAVVTSWGELDVAP